MYVSDPWGLWAEKALQFGHNALFKTAVTPPPAPPHNGSLDVVEDYVKLSGAKPWHIHTAAVRQLRPIDDFTDHDLNFTLISISGKPMSDLPMTFY